METYNRLILNIACTICIFEGIKTFLSIDVSRANASWEKGNHFVIEKHVKILILIRKTII